MEKHLVRHKTVGLGYGVFDPKSERWSIKFFACFSKAKLFNKNAFEKGYLKDCGLVSMEGL